MFAPAHLRDPRRDRAVLGAALVGLTALAWISLVAWASSPYGPYLGHDAGVAAPVPVEAALLADSGPATPATAPWPNSSGRRESFFSSA